jgi:polar amino acid transport system substrate-binding protein
MRTTTRRAGALLAALALTAAACGGDDTGSEATDDGAAEGNGEAAAEFDLVTDGTLTVCSDVPYAPFEVEDSEAPSGFSGFDIDLMQAVAEDLGLELAVTVTPFDSITNATAMTRGDCDIAASAITINEEREENVDFSEPYYDSLQSLAVPADSDVASLEDTDGTRLGVQTGTTGEAYARENAPEGAEIVDFANPGDLFAGLAAGNIDAILQDLPVNAERARTDEEIEVVDEYDTGEQYGFAVEDGRDDGLLEAVDEGMNGLRDDGTYDELYDQYFAAE